uniref:Uncharacterized protein n=1 Tax=Strombidium inclinatum TaxID=197538 RepID=A0A7S3MWV5_9SPIT
MERGLWNVKGTKFGGEVVEKRIIYAPQEEIFSFEFFSNWFKFRTEKSNFEKDRLRFVMSGVFVFYNDGKTSELDGLFGDAENEEDSDYYDEDGNEY